VDGYGRITAAADVAITGGGGGGVVIGAPVTGGTPTYILYVDVSGDVGQSSGLTYNPATSAFEVISPGAGNPAISGLGDSGSTAYGQMGQYLSGTGGFGVFGAYTGFVGYLGYYSAMGTSAAGFFGAGGMANVVLLCDGTNYITYAPGAPANWASAPPTDVWVALDRIVAWILANVSTGAWVTVQPNP
jgi:hypothetical protein